MKSIFCLLSLPAFLLLGACTTVPKVQTQYNPQADFSDVKTFALLPMPSQITGADPGLMVELAGPASDTIISDLEAKGYQLAPKDSADIWVSMHGELLPRTQVIDTGLPSAPAYYDAGWYGAYPYANQQIVRNYEQGTLAIEIFKNKSDSGDLSWVGWTTQKRAPGAPVNIDKALASIREILADFPPEKK